jgi:circadian clock protein KaiC
VRVGIDGLDDVLMGGLLRHNNVLLEGPAGAGKTTLALSFLHAGAVFHQEPGLLVSFEHSPGKLLRDARGFGWDLEGLMRQGTLKVVETTPAYLLKELRQTRLVDGSLANELRSLGIKRLVIDGLTPWRLAHEAVPGQTESFRSALSQVIGALTRLGITTMVTSESDGRSSAQLADERYVFDTVIAVDLVSRTLTAQPSAPSHGLRRTLEVLKSRGQDFVHGRHTLRIEAGRGAVVYQRAHSRLKSFVPSSAQPERELHSFGSLEIDALFGGGLYAGSITMVSGIAGAGKTVAGMQFLAAGAQMGEAGLMVSLDEQPAQLTRNAKSLGFPIDAFVSNEQLSFLYESPLDLELDVHFDRFVRMVDERNIQRVVFDSLALYEKSCPEDVIGFMYAVAAFCKARGLLTVVNYESPALHGVSQLSESIKGSQLVDNIVLLSYLEIADDLRRGIAVPKARGRGNLQTTREYVIREGGLTLLPRTPRISTDPADPSLGLSSSLGMLARAQAQRGMAVEPMPFDER